MQQRVCTHPFPCLHKPTPHHRFMSSLREEDVTLIAPLREEDVTRMETNNGRTQNQREHK